MEFTYKLSEPEKILTFHGDAVTGIITSHTKPSMLTVARYNGAEFWVYDVKIDSDKDVPTLEKRLIVSNSPLANWRGEAISAQLWNEHQPRAQVAQVSNDGKELLYLNNGGRSIGRIQLPFVDIKPEVKPALAGIVGDRAEYFLQLRDGTLAVIENYDDCVLRLYRPMGNNLDFMGGSGGIKLGGSLFYGLAQDNDDEIMMLVPKKGNYPLESNKEPGVYRLGLRGSVLSDTLQKDPLFDAITLPADLRGLAPVFSEGALHGYLMSTYRAARDSLNGGEPSELFYTKVLKE